MESNEQGVKVLRSLGWFIICVGIFEVFYYIFLTGELPSMIIGLITVISAYFLIEFKNKKWGYFVAIWALFKYNPFVGAFMLGDMIHSHGDNAFKPPVIFLIALFVLVGLASFVLGIVLIVKTSGYLKLMKHSLGN